MANIFDVRVPEWLERITKPPDAAQIGKDIGGILAGGVNALQRDPDAPADAGYLESRKGFAKGYQEGRMQSADPMWQMKAEQMKLTAQTKVLMQQGALAKIKGAAQAAELRTKQVGLEEDDSTLLAETMNGLENQLDLANVTPPAFKTTKYATMFSKMQRDAAQGLLAKNANHSAAQFDAQLGALFKVDPDAAGSIQNMSRDKYGLPSTMARQALGVASDRAKLHAENIAAQARNDALARGEDVSTTITGDKVTERFTPAKPEKPDATLIKPMTETLKDGSLISWMPGGKGIHIIRKGGGERKELTPNQLMTISKGLDDKDPDKKKLIDAAKGAALKQTTNAPVAAPTTPEAKKPSAANPYKVGSQYGNLRYKGGDPNNASNWEKVGSLVDSLEP